MWRATTGPTRCVAFGADFSQSQPDLWHLVPKPPNLGDRLRFLTIRSSKHKILFEKEFP
jgi:hypothetical protein